ncbi:MAG: protein kinase, partial [Chthoniobacterales bacterium]
MDNRIFLQRYRLSRGRNGQPVELHRTPTSVTYRAQEIETGREVALERVTADISNPGLRELLESEATTARQIRHINIPRLYDFGFDQDELIYVTEYFDGHTAAASLAAQGPLHPAAVFQIALQVVAAMDAMAFHSIHHHALNPDNLVFVADAPSVGDSHPIKVLHWLGVAPLFTETNDPRLDNAARFTSPEQLYTGKVDVRSEIYSLGCT